MFLYFQFYFFHEHMLKYNHIDQFLKYLKSVSKRKIPFYVVGNKKDLIALKNNKHLKDDDEKEKGGKVRFI